MKRKQESKPRTRVIMVRVPEEHVAGNVRVVPIDSLRMSYAPLRPGCVAPRTEQGAELPLRVAPCRDTVLGKAFEVLDGFKRLERWREQGHETIPVVVEAPSRAAEHKRLLLAVNAPARTITALDEARVVCSLIDKDDMTPTQVARLLGHKPEWVGRRRAIGTRLSPSAEQQVASGAMGPTLAHALTALTDDEQDAMLESIRKHGLKASESLLLISAFRAADPADRKQLLRSPLEQLRGEEASRPTLSPRSTQLEAQLHCIRRALADLEAFHTPAELAPAEQRRLEALYRGAIDDVQRLASVLGPPTQHLPIVLQEKVHDQHRPTEPDYSLDSAPGGSRSHQILRTRGKRLGANGAASVSRFRTRYCNRSWTCTTSTVPGRSPRGWD